MNIYHNHHIIPRHMGGTDDPSNLIKLSIEEHAEAHRILYEQHGHQEDKLAWLGLLGMVSKKEILLELQKDPKYKKQISDKLRKLKTGVKRSKESRKKMSGSKCIYTYQITFPDGSQVITKNLWKFCKEEYPHLNYAAMWKTAKGLQSHHKNHRVKYI